MLQCVCNKIDIIVNSNWIWHEHWQNHWLHVYHDCFVQHYVTLFNCVQHVPQHMRGPMRPMAHSSIAKIWFRTEHSFSWACGCVHAWGVSATHLAFSSACRVKTNRASWHNPVLNINENVWTMWKHEWASDAPEPMMQSLWNSVKSGVDMLFWNMPQEWSQKLALLDAYGKRQLLEMDSPRFPTSPSM